MLINYYEYFFYILDGLKSQEKGCQKKSQEKDYTRLLGEFELPKHQQ